MTNLEYRVALVNGKVEYGHSILWALMKAVGNVKALKIAEFSRINPPGTDHNLYAKNGNLIANVEVRYYGINKATEYYE